MVTEPIPPFPNLPTFGDAGEAGEAGDAGDAGLLSSNALNRSDSLPQETDPALGDADAGEDDDHAAAFGEAAAGEEVDHEAALGDAVVGEADADVLTEGLGRVGAGAPLVTPEARSPKASRIAAAAS